MLLILEMVLFDRQLEEVTGVITQIKGRIKLVKSKLFLAFLIIHLLVWGTVIMRLNQKKNITVHQSLICTL